MEYKNGIVISGICAYIGDNLNIDAFWIRMIFIICATQNLFTTTLMYLILSLFKNK